MRAAVFCTVFVAAFMTTAVAQTALSPRNANYTIDARLDPTTRTITASETVVWRNITPTTATERGSGLVEIELDQAQAWDWLTFLTDLRLILAERVGVVDEDADEADEQRDDYLRAAYEWAGIVQGSMLEVLDPMQG